MINISIVKAEQFCSRKEKTRRVTLNAIQLSVHFIIIMIQFFLYIYCLRKHEKQCRQNFAIVIFIYGGSMTAKAECRHKFRGPSWC